ncbi:MAG TPA: HAMP domain-containing sensor histidine kinase [Saprospiraceae bacterium]|nr:HAMP domain-containing sensor histidine kinase [Saprospiraceae bacterium]
MQIRNRLTIQFLIIVASLLLVAMGFIHVQFKAYLEREHYANLRSKALMTAEMLLNKKQPISPEANEDEHTNLSTNSENITIYSNAFKRIFSFYPSPDTVHLSVLKEIGLRKEVQFTRGKFKSLGLYYTNQFGNGFYIITDGIFNPVHLATLSRILVIAFCLLIAVVAAGGWFFSGQALAPVTRIMNQIDAILPHDLSQRLDQTRHADELSRLVHAFNNLLDRIQHVFKNQKLFLSNISHELKNALSVIQSQLQISLDKDRAKEEYQVTLDSVLDDVKELSEVSDKLMQLAKINADDTQIVFEKVRIDELIWQARAMLMKSHPEYQVHLEMENLPEDVDCLVVSGNEPLLRTALFNLIENGCKFGIDNQVRVQLSQTSQGSTQVEICDTGPGISADELSLVFEPFYRSNNTASIKGSGVGLSLVHSILKLHQVTMKVSSQLNAGTTFRLEFPYFSQMKPVA